LPVPKKKHTFGFTLATVCVFALGACSTAATLTPRPTVKQAAATAYLAASSKANGATTAAIKLCSGAAPTAAQYQACYAALGADDQAFIHSLATIQFPPEMEADVEALTSALTQSAAAESALAAAPDPNADYNDSSALKTAEAARIAAAATIRTDLGLPAVPLTPKPPPTVNQAAAAAYLAAATTFNAADDAASKLCPGNTPTTAQLTACYGAYYTADQAFIQAIFAITFPPEMKADVDGLIKAETQVASADDSIASSSDPNSDYADFATDRTAGNDEVAAAGVVRHDLGLPPVPLSTPAP
jgi:hypothetical protein